MHVPRYLYKRSMCRYVRLNTLNVLHVHGPCFNAPIIIIVRIILHIIAFGKKRGRPIRPKQDDQINKNHMTKYF